HIGNFLPLNGSHLFTSQSKKGIFMKKQLTKLGFPSKIDKPVKRRQSLPPARSAAKSPKGGAHNNG
ncbi:MAG: hypothetical protein ACI3VY_08560, partial [Faecousia sp.]